MREPSKYISAVDWVNGRGEIMDNQLEEFLLDPEVQVAMNYGKERNIFNILGLSETRHSKMLAWLFDPREGHLQKDYFLKELLREAFRNKEGVNNSFFENWDVADLEGYSFGNAVSFTELVIGKDNKRKIDVAIFDVDNELAVFIENKTGSSEGVDQTTEYFKELSKEYKGFDQVFIFMDENENEAKDEGNWVNIGYSWLIQAMSNLLDRNVLDAEIEMLLSQYKEYLSGDYTANHFFKRPYTLLSKVAKKHAVFLNKLETKSLSFEVSMLANFEKNKLLCIYKQYEAFFEALFESNEFEHVVENIQKEKKDLEIEYYKRSFYIHRKGWRRFYVEDADIWGVQFYLKKENDDDSCSGRTYQMVIRIVADVFKNRKAAGDLATSIQKRLGRKGKKYIYIYERAGIEDDQLEAFILEGIDEVENFLKEVK